MFVIADWQPREAVATAGPAKERRYRAFRRAPVGVHTSTTLR